MVSIREKVSLAGIVEIDGQPYKLTRNPETDEPLFNASLEIDKPEAAQEFREHAGFGPDGLGGSLPLVEGQFHYALGVDSSERGVLKAGLRYDAMGLSIPAPVTKLVAAQSTEGGAGTTGDAPTGASSGSPAWSNPTNIAAEDAAVASVALNSSQTSGQLLATDFGLAPATDPTAITVQAKARYTGAAGTGSTMTAQLRNHLGTAIGAAVTKPLSDTLDWLSFPFSAATVALLDAANINDADFGVILTAAFPSAGGSGSGSQTKSVAGTIDAGSSGIGVNWTNAANANQVDTVYATVTLDEPTVGTSDLADTLTLTNWSFAIPAGAIPADLTVSVTGLAIKSGAFFGAMNVRVSAQLVIGGTPAGNTVVLGSITSTSPQTVSNGGGLSSVWGVTLSEAQLESATFGVALTCENTSSGPSFVSTGTFYLDGASIEVDYTGASAPGSGTVEVDHVTLTVETDATAGGVILYAAAANTLTKVSVSTATGLPVVTLQNVKTFTHGDDGAPPDITDVIILKDGDNPGNAAGLVGFGGAAQLQQIDAIASTGADTYGALEATDKAYAGKFALAQGAEGTERRVWKSTGTNGQNGGHFSRLQNSPIVAADVDYTDAVLWEPLTPYQSGDYGSDILAIAEFQTGIVASAAEGVYQFNDVGNSYYLYSTRATRSTENGNTLLPWGSGLLIATATDLVRVPEEMGGTWGIRRLVSNRSVVGGFPTAMASYGDELVIAYYDGLDSHILWAKQRTNSRVNHPLVFYPIRRVENYRVDALAVFADAQGAVWGFHPGPKEGDPTLTDLYSTLLAPDRVVRYAESGYLETTMQGTTDVASKIERAIGYAENVGASLGRWRISVSVDNGDYAVLGDWIEAEGRFEVRPDGIDDEGYLYRFKYEFENDVPSNCPTLIGVADTPGEAGGLAIEGKRMEEPAFRFEFLTTIKDDDRGPVGQLLPGSVTTRANYLFDRSRTYVELAADEWPFSTVPLEVFIESVTMAMGEKDIPDNRELKLRVKGRAKAGVRG